MFPFPRVETPMGEYQVVYFIVWFSFCCSPLDSNLSLTGPLTKCWVGRRCVPFFCFSLNKKESDSTGVDSSEILLLGYQQCFLVAAGVPGSAGSPWWSTGAQDKSASTLSSIADKPENTVLFFYNLFVLADWGFLTDSSPSV